MIDTALASVCQMISGATAEWRCDRNSDVQRIYFGNHSSHLDFVVIWSALPSRLRRRTRPVAGRDYWAHGAVRRYLASDVFRAVLIDRGNAGSANAADAARASIARLTEAMGDRDSLIVFPEGTRSLSGQIGPFRSGLFHLSRARPDVELIPVRLENLHRVLPRGEMLPVPMLSRTIFGAPLCADDDESKDEFLGRARLALTQLAHIE